MQREHGEEEHRQHWPREEEEERREEEEEARAAPGSLGAAADVGGGRAGSLPDDVPLGAAAGVLRPYLLQRRGRRLGLWARTAGRLFVFIMFYV
jgi:hypothetical protein